MNFTYYISRELSVHFNQPVKIEFHQQVFGGNINQAFQLQTNIGSFFLKLNDGSLKDMFEKEFAGLQLVYQTQTIKIPQPVLQANFKKKFFSLLNLFNKGICQKTSGKHLHISLLIYTNDQIKNLD